MVLQRVSLRQLVARSDLFDPNWYQATYPDVAASGLAPLDHFVRFGLLLDRDPGPLFCSLFFRHAYDPDTLGDAAPLVYHLQNSMVTPDPDLAFHAAMQVFLQGRHDLALTLARIYLPDHLAQTRAAFAANRAWMDDDMAGWQAAMNAYLAFYRLAPIALRPADTLLGQLHCQGLRDVTNGPLISVIMPVWNAQDTVAVAVDSILAQTWRNLELIAVDDASTDASWAILQKIAARDPRLRPIRNSRNAGPYVAKNIGLQHTQGAYITGHDADDWAHPERLDRHMLLAMTRPDPLPVSMPYGLRMQPDGLFHHTRRARVATSFDGWMQSAPIGTLFAADFLKNRLGYWDSVRFGADTEMLLRARHVLGAGPLEVPLMSMICLDAPHSLSNDAAHGTRAGNGGLSPTRRAYLRSVHNWLDTCADAAPVFMDFPQDPPRYVIPEKMQVRRTDIVHNITAATLPR